MSQQTFSSLAYNQKKKVTRREKFLFEMEHVVPWKRLERVAEPHYPDIGNGRPPIGLGRMLRIYFMQQWFNLADEAMEDSLYDSESMRRFAGIELGRDPVPDSTTMLRFRHMLEEHNLTQGLLSEVNEHLKGAGLLLREGTIVDATIIDAPTSTKNKDKRRDPEMHQVKKGNEWYFGMKAHIGTDLQGLAHTVVCTPANVADGNVMNDLIHGEELAVYGDRAYSSVKRKAEYEANGIAWRVQKMNNQYRPLTKRERAWNSRMSRVRARGEHAFGIVKNIWGHSKVRYRGIKKNAAQFCTLFALANLYLVRHKILKLQARSI